MNEKEYLDEEQDKNELETSDDAADEQSANENKTNRYYVRYHAPYLTVCEADDLHNPGRYLIGQQVGGESSEPTFQLLNRSPEPGCSRRFCAGTGVINLTRKSRRWHLKILGAVVGFASDGAVVLDTVEEYF